MAKIKDGWHVICGYDVYVEDGRVKRGTTGELATYRSVYPYRWNKQERCYVNDSGLTVNAFRAGIRRGTIEML